MKKILFLFVVIVFGAVALLYFFGSSLISKAVETVGPKVTQTPVRLDNVELSLLSSSSMLQGLYIGNPEGFNKEYIFSLNQIDVEIEPQSLLSDQLTFRKIHIRNPEMNYEKTLSGSNLKSLLANVESFGQSVTGEKAPKATAPAGPSTDSEKKSRSRRIMINELLIEDLNVRVGVLGAGTSISIPRIELNNLDSGSTTEAVAKVLQAVLSELTRQLGAGVSSVGKGSLSGLEAVGKKAIQQVKEGQGKTNKENGETTANDLIDDVINLFGR